VRLLIERGADVHARSKAGFTPFLFGVRHPVTSPSRRFVMDAGADVNETATDGTTAPLWWPTVRNHNRRLATFLLDHGADPNKGTRFPRPLHWAVGEWSYSDVLVDSAFRHLSEGNEVEFAPGDWQDAVKPAFVKLLLAHGADPKRPPPEGNPPKYGRRPSSRWSVRRRDAVFFVAAKNGDAPMMRILVAAGADPQLSAKDKRFAAHGGGRGGAFMAPTSGTRAQCPRKRSSCAWSWATTSMAQTRVGETAAARRCVQGCHRIVVHHPCSVSERRSVECQG